MSAAKELEARIHGRLAALRAGDLLRVMRPPAGVDLSSNDYLQLSTHPAITAAFAAGILAEGAGSTGSRLLRGERSAFAEVERRFAAFKGADKALFFSSGYLANLAVLTTIVEADDVIFSDALNHASLIDAVRLSRATRVVFPHNDPAALASLIDATPSSGIRFIVVESLFSMDGDVAPLAEYARICRERDAVLIVDEAHAVGIFGSEGTGLIEALGAAPDVLLSVNTAGKALGVGGAFVAGPSWAIEYLVQRARPFVFSTAAPPAMAHALLASLDVVRDEPHRRARLRQLARYLRERLRDAGVDVVVGESQIVPVHIGANDVAVAVAEALQADGFDVRAIRPPTVPEGTARLRVSVNTGVDEHLLDRFVHVLTRALKEAGLCSAVSS
ncbi:MAG: 8-amino-7-oxononanoate synthase [Acidobacteria bacterium]|nr:8-amino-7-oxononanoate synthase [Acidobacteriota bacterium]